MCGKCERARKCEASPSYYYKALELSEKLLILSTPLPHLPRY